MSGKPKKLMVQVAETMQAPATGSVFPTAILNRSSGGIATGNL